MRESVARVVLFGSGSPISTAAYRALASRHRVVAVVVPAARRPRSVRGLVRALRRWRGAQPLAALARSDGVPVLAHSPQAETRLEEALRALSPDVVCVASFPALLGPGLRGVAPRGAIGLHSSLLPRHRGPDPLFWTYWQGDPEAGVTVFWLDSGMDTGDILRQEAIPIARGRPSLDTYGEIAERGARLLVDAATEVATGTAPRRPQAISPEEAEPTPRKARPSIDASWNAERAWHVLSGLGGRVALLRDSAGRPVQHGQATALRHEPHDRAPGTVEPHARGWRLYCADGVVDVARSQGPSLQARAAAWALPALVVLMPFEARRPTLPAFGTEVTILEGAALVVTLLLLVTGRRRVALVCRRPPRPLAFLAGFAAAHLLSAAFAPAEAAPAGLSALRMVAAAVFATAVAAAPPKARERSLGALVLAAVIVAALAVPEAMRYGPVDEALAGFRERRFGAWGARRAAAGSENPNLAAAFVMYGLVAAAATARRTRPTSGGVILAVLLSAGLLATYSRGVLVATGVALVAVLAALAASGDRPPRWKGAAVVLGVLVLATAGFLVRPSFRAHLGEEFARRGYAVRYADVPASFRAAPGQWLRLGLGLVNSGREPWRRGAIWVHHEWYDLDRERMLLGRSLPLSADVASGEAVHVDLRARAPLDEGRYVILCDVADHDAGSFSAFGVAPALISVVVARDPSIAPLPSPAVLPPSAWRHGRLALWKVALSMWRRHPWTGVGSDNFRRLHAGYGGWISLDVPASAHNAWLEAAATTGVLGLVTFTGTLLAAGAAGARGLRRFDPRAPETTLAVAVCGLVVALATHGIVEYVFAFTGHYLVLGLVVGCAAALSVASGERLAPGNTGPLGAEDGGHPREQRGEGKRA